MRKIRFNVPSACARGFLLCAAAALSCAFPLEAEAKTLYVNAASGNDAVTYAANGAAAPWRSIGRAAWGNANRSSPNALEAAQAGDIVLIAAGTYDTAVNTGTSYDVIYSPANSGTSGNPITFQAVGTVTLTTSGGGAGVLIGALSRDYIVWKGFTIDEANAPSYGNTGLAAIFSSTGGGIENCILDGNGNPGHGDNHPGVRIESSRGVTVRNNIIHDFTTSVVNANNGTGIQVYNSYGLTIEHNEIYGNGSGMFLKELISGMAGTTVIRYNLIYANNNAGIAIHRMGAGQAFSIYQNIVRGNNEGLRFWGFDAATFPRNTSLVNNTFSGNIYMGVNFQYNMEANAGNRIYNNIFYNEAAALYSETAAISNIGDKTRLDAEHNVYFAVANAAQLGGSPYALAAWKTASGQDGANPAASSSDPMFVDPAAHNYKLRVGSPLLAQGADVLDLNGNGSTADAVPAGAYITGAEVIGLLPAGTSTDAAPAKPRGLRIL